MTAQPATESIWSELCDDLRRFVRRRVRTAEIADDLLQETFLRIHRSIGTLSVSDRLAAWVYQIARNVIQDHYRKQKGDVSLAGIDPIDEEDGGGHLRAGAGVWLGELIDQLPEPYRHAVRLSEIEGLTQREVAEQISLSLSGTKSRIQRGRVMLKEVLDRCCFFQFDRRGNVTDCDPKPDRTVCRDCGDLEIPPIG